MFMPHIDQVNNNIDELLAHDNIEKLQSYDLKSTYTDSKTEPLSRHPRTVKTMNKNNPVKPSIISI